MEGRVGGPCVALEVKVAESGRGQSEGAVRDEVGEGVDSMIEHTLLASTESQEVKVEEGMLLNLFGLTET